MKDFIQNLQLIFRKDTTGEGESNKLVVVLRVMEAVLLIYSAVNCAFAFANSLYTLSLVYFSVFIVYFVFLHLSYRIRTHFQLLFVNIFAVVSILIGVRLLGIHTFMQNLLLVLVILDFFAEYGRYKRKAMLAAIMCGIFIYVNTQEENPMSIPLTAHHVMGLQVINIIFVFLLIGIISYIYSRDSQSLEGKLVEYNKQLKKQASTDALTGLCNRRTAIEFINEQIKEHSEIGFCACMCDIDFFKVVNDSYGHDIGDKVLRGVADAMVNGFPQSCLISRWGGEEFLVVFPRMNGDDAKMLLDIMRTKIKSLEFSAGEKKFGVTVTYGLAEYGFDYDADKLVKEADEKLYMGKQNGRDQVVF